MYLEDKDFIILRDFMFKNYGIDLSKKKDLIQSRLTMTVAQKGMRDFSEYVQKLVHDTTGVEASVTVSKLTTNYTYFMREEANYKFINDTVLPTLISRIKDNQLRSWSAGCSSGEEAYTLAMYYDNYFGMRKSQWNTHILASDISDAILEKARQGLYTEDKMQYLPMDWKRRYFITKPDGEYEISPTLKKEVEFKKLNLMDKNYHFGRKFHIILCRNVMIYFNMESRRELINHFYEELEPGGFFFTGLSESIISLGTKFTYVRPAVYRKLE